MHVYDLKIYIKRRGERRVGEVDQYLQLVRTLPVIYHNSLHDVEIGLYHCCTEIHNRRHSSTRARGTQRTQGRFHRTHGFLELFQSLSLVI